MDRFSFFENSSVLIKGGMGPVIRPHVAMAAVNATGPEYRTRATRKHLMVITAQRVISENYRRVRAEHRTRLVGEMPRDRHLLPLSEQNLANQRNGHAPLAHERVV